MFKWLRAYLKAWNQMFQPSEERKSFEAELISRPTSTDAQWASVYGAVGKEFARDIVALIEKEAEWPQNKLLPTDSLVLLFHGKADEEMPFGLFRADVRRTYGVNLFCADVFDSLDADHQTLEGLITLIEHKKVQNDSCRKQFSLMSFLLLGGAIPIWIFLSVAVPQSTGWRGSPIRFVITPLVLTGITVAIHRLLRQYRNAWAISVLLAPVIALSSLYVAAWMSR